MPTPPMADLSRAAPPGWRTDARCRSDNAVHFYAPTAESPGYQDGANWVNVLFTVYNGVAAVAALLLLPFLAARIGRVRTHIAALLCGAAGRGCSATSSATSPGCPS